MTTPFEPVTVLNVDDRAPYFSVSAYPNGLITLDEFVGRTNFILAFYVDDEGPGSIAELIAFTNYSKQFESAGCEIVCCSRDDIESHRLMFERHQLGGLVVLSDASGDVGKAYGAIRGDRHLPDRLLYFIDRSGIIRYVYKGMPDCEELLTIARKFA